MKIARSRTRGYRFDLGQHFRVVIGNEFDFTRAAARHRQPAHEISQPNIGGAFFLGIFMQKVVQLPRFVTDPEIVRLLSDDIVKDHEIGQEDLIHPPIGLKGMHRVLAGLRFDVLGFVRQQCARRMDVLAMRSKHLGHWMLREPGNLQFGPQLAKRFGDGDIPAGVAETDRRGDEERAFGTRLGSHPRPVLWPRRMHSFNELAQQAIDPNRIARVRHVPRSFARHVIASECLCERGAPTSRDHPIVGAMDDQGWTSDLCRERQRRGFIAPGRPLPGQNERFWGRVERPADAIFDLLR